MGTKLKNKTTSRGARATKYLRGNIHGYPNHTPMLLSTRERHHNRFCLVTPNAVDLVHYITMTPYDLQTLGDHRGMLIDINIKELLASKNLHLDITSGRKLLSGNPKSVTKYLEKVRRGFEKQNIGERAKKLLHRVHNKRRSPRELMRRYNILDGDLFRIYKRAEQKCRRTISRHHH